MEFESVIDTTWSLEKHFQIATNLLRTYLSVVVDTVYLGGWAHVETDEEEEHNMWRYSLMFDESDNKWYIESIDSVLRTN